MKKEVKNDIINVVEQLEDCYDKLKVKKNSNIYFTSVERDLLTIAITNIKTSMDCLYDVINE